MKRLMVLGVAGLLSVSALAACSDDDTEGAVQDANAEFCQNLTAYGAAVADLAALDPTTATKDDYSSAVDEVTSTREDVVESAGDLSDAEWANLEEQVDTLRDQLEDAPDDEAVATILAEAQPQAAKVQASIATVNTAVCTTENATTTTGG